MKLCTPHERMKFFSNKSDTAFCWIIFSTSGFQMKKINYNKHADLMETCLNVGQFEREIEKLTDAARVDKADLRVEVILFFNLFLRNFNKYNRKSQNIPLRFYNRVNNLIDLNY